MKILSIGLLTLGAFSAFANSGKVLQCSYEIFQDGKKVQALEVSIPLSEIDEENPDQVIIGDKTVMSKNGRFEFRAFGRFDPKHVYSGKDFMIQMDVYDSKKDIALQQFSHVDWVNFYQMDGKTTEDRKNGFLAICHF